MILPIINLSAKLFNKVKTKNKHGIYIIQNNINKKIYIGSALNLANRKACHLKDLRQNKHKNPYLQNAYNKYNENNFIFYLAEYIENKKYLIKIEQLYLDVYKPYNKSIGYNIAKIAGSTLGIYPSKETKLKQSISARRRGPHYIGEKCASAKLNWNSVFEIRNKYKTGLYYQKDLAKEYNVDRHTIGDIINYISWKENNNKEILDITFEIAEEIKNKYRTGKYTKIKLYTDYNISKQYLNKILNNKLF